MNSDKSNDSGPRFLSMPLPQGMAGAARETTPPTKHTAAPKHDNVHDTTMVASGSTWASLDKLPKLSYYYHLEPTHTTFARDSLPRVLEKLTRALRALSCHVTYDDAYLAATCTTMETVKFQVSVFAARSSDSNNTCILELQRSAGDPIIFHQRYVQPLLALDTAQMTWEQDPCTVMEFPYQLDRLCRCTTDDETMEESDDESGDLFTALRLATEMIDSQVWDARLGGLQTFMALTDPSQCGMETATRIARMIPNLPVAPTLEQLLLWENDASTSLGVLRVWSQIWHLDNDNTPVSTAVTERLESFVQHAHTAPHHATLALRGLTALGRVPSPEIISSLPCARHAAWEHALRRATTSVQG